MIPAKFNTSVELGQELRFLAMDYRKYKHIFIRPYELHTVYYPPSQYAESVKSHQYHPKAAYVFRVNQFYSEFSGKQIMKAKRWAEEQCIEERIMPIGLDRKLLTGDGTSDKKYSSYAHAYREDWRTESWNYRGYMDVMSSYVLLRRKSQDIEYYI